MDLRRSGLAVTIGVLAVVLVLSATMRFVLGKGNQVNGAPAFSQVATPGSDGVAGRPPINWPGQRPESESSEASPIGQPFSQLDAVGPAYANCRFGVGVVRNPIDVYTDLDALRLGWYLDWKASSDPLIPNGIEYVQTIRLSQPRDADGNYLPTYSVNPTVTEKGLGALLDAAPGAIWTVGNEPDVWSQDGITPDIYAKAYHRIYHFIKARDPSALVAIAAVVQPSPVRLLYLDMILDHYSEMFGEPMPVDVWNIHLYILREVVGDWGAQLPPGVDSDLGIDYPVEAHGNITVFSELVSEFRRWMTKHGQQNKPLIITEMGVLMPEWWQPIFNEARVKQFMNDSFDYLLSAADPNTGYAADNYHLVQKWSWFSLDDDSVDATDALRWNGMLYNSKTRVPTSFGDEYARYTGQLLPTVDLVAAGIKQQPEVAYSPTSPVTITLNALVTNAGNTHFADPVRVRFYDTTGGTKVQIGSDQVLTGLSGCAMQLATASVEWPNVTPGAHRVRIEVDPTDLVSEQNEANNVALGVVLVATDLALLPVSAR